MADPTAPLRPGDDALAAVRTLLDRATGRLLGDTITLDDTAWRAPSRLPGWSRGHLATHVARNADALARLLAGVVDGVPAAMYASPEARDAEIAAGADRPGAELHADLDTSAAALAELLDRTAEDPARWDRSVTLRGGSSVAAGVVPCLRLDEVALHHVDLDVGVELDDLDADTRWWCLWLTAHRLGGRLPGAARLEPDDGDPITLAGPGTPVVVADTSARLLGWLTRRSTDVPDVARGWDVPAL